MIYDIPGATGDAADASTDSPDAAPGMVTFEDQSVPDSWSQLSSGACVVVKAPDNNHAACCTAASVDDRVGWTVAITPSNPASAQFDLAIRTPPDDVATSFSTIVQFDDDERPGNGSIGVLQVHPGPRFGTDATDSALREQPESAYPLTQWLPIVFTINGAAGTLELYASGIKIVDASGDLQGATPGYVHIGITFQGANTGEDREYCFDNVVITSGD